MHGTLNLTLDFILTHVSTYRYKIIFNNFVGKYITYGNQKMSNLVDTNLRSLFY